jgi:hypothetical protein
MACGDRRCQVNLFAAQPVGGPGGLSPPQQLFTLGRSRSRLLRDTGAVAQCELESALSFHRTDALVGSFTVCDAPVPPLVRPSPLGDPGKGDVRILGQNWPSHDAQRCNGRDR